MRTSIEKLETLRGETIEFCINEDGMCELKVSEKTGESLEILLAKYEAKEIVSMIARLYSTELNTLEDYEKALAAEANKVP